MVGINLSSHQVKSLALTCTSICALTYLSKKKNQILFINQILSIYQIYTSLTNIINGKNIYCTILNLHTVLKYKMGLRTKLFYVSTVSNDAN